MIHDSKTLSALSRAELQEVALKFGVNTTLKSHTIIKRLLAIKADNSVSDAANSNEAPLTADNLAAHNSFVGVTSESLHVPRRPKPSAPPPSDFDFPSQHSSDIGDDVGDDEPLASQEQLKATVNMMAEMDRQHKATRRKVEKLQATAEELREHVALLRQAIASQRGRRERLEKYMLYWQKEPQRWSFEQIWDYPMRVWDDKIPGYNRLEVTSSNGDGPTEEEKNAVIEHGIPLAGKHFQKQPLPIPQNSGRYDFLETGVTNVSAPLDATRSKRRREEDDDETPVDVERYQARIRKESPKIQNSSTSLKGKGKMSAENVQRMQEEARQNHLLQEQESQALGLSAEAIEEDRVAGMAVAGKASTPSSAPRIKRRNKSRMKSYKQSISKGPWRNGLYRRMRNA